MKIVNRTWFYGLRTTTFAHKVFILTTFVTQSFDLKMTYLRCWHSRQKRYFSDTNYLIKHNIKVLLYSIIQTNVCLRIQNLKKIEKWFTNKDARAISVRDVFNKNIVKALTAKNTTFKMQITQ